MDRPKDTKGPLYHLAPLGASVGLYYASLVFPLALALAAVPLFYAMASRGRRYGVTIAIGASMTIFVLSGVEWALVFTSVCVSLALAESEALRRNAKLGATVAMGALLSFSAVMGMFYINVAGSGKGFTQTSRDLAEKAVTVIIEKQDASAGNKEVAEYIEANKQTWVWAFSSVFPALVMNMVIFLALVSHLTGVWLSKRHGWGIHSSEHDHAKWRSPDKLLWILAGGLALSISGAGGAFAAMGLNILLVLGMVYALQGLSLVQYWLQVAGARQVAQVLAYMFMLVAMPWSVILLWTMGLFDAVIDFRSSGAESGNSSGE